MDESQGVSNDAEDENQEIQELMMAESVAVLANGQPVPCPQPLGDKALTAFAIGAPELKALLYRSSLPAVAGNTGSLALIEVLPGRIAVSTTSGVTAARASFKSGTQLRKGHEDGVQFSIEVGKLMKISDYCEDSTLMVALVPDGTDYSLEIIEIKTHKLRGGVKYNLTVHPGTLCNLLAGVRTPLRRDISTRNLATALRLCAAARPPSRRGECYIEVGDGIASGYSQGIAILVRNAALTCIGTQILPADARKLALAIRHMDPANVFETDSSFIISDGGIEVAIRKSARPQLKLANVLARFIEEEIYVGPIQGLRKPWFINEMAKQYSKIAMRKGEPPPPVQLTQIGVESGKVKARLIRRRINAETTAEHFTSVTSTEDRVWGAIDLSSLMQVWAAVYPNGDGDKQVRISACGKFLKLTSPDDNLEAYFPFGETGDPRFRN